MSDPAITPTIEDRQKAAIWTVAKEQDADIWRLLSNEQKAMVDARIEWAMGHNGRSDPSADECIEPGDVVCPRLGNCTDCAGGSPHVPETEHWGVDP